jgi:hypothetical protein
MEVLETPNTPRESVISRRRNHEIQLIFGIPYESGRRIIIPMAELLQSGGAGSGVTDRPPEDRWSDPNLTTHQGLIQERSLGMISVDGSRADFAPINKYGCAWLIFVAAAILAVGATLVRAQKRRAR